MHPFEGQNNRWPQGGSRFQPLLDRTLQLAKFGW
jgi:hypothetical protein